MKSLLTIKAKTRHKAVAVLLLVMLPIVVQAEDLSKILERVGKFAQDENYTKALEELKWAQNELDKLHTAHLGTFFPEKIQEFAGDKIKPASVLGMVELKRTYRKGNEQVLLSLIGGSSGATGNPFGQIARFGALMGGQNGQETLRINGKTSTLKDEGKGRAELTMFLDSGFMLKLESRDARGDALRAMAETLDVDNLEKYLKG
jgi:hypothetical protein